jgi:hypothetical protein
MSIDAIVAESEIPFYIPLRKQQREYGGYQNKTDKMPWHVQDIPFKELSRGLCGYCEVLSTKAIAVGNWLKSDMPELARTIWHEVLHRNGMLDEYATLANENAAFASDIAPYRKLPNY